MAQSDTALAKLLRKITTINDNEVKAAVLSFSFVFILMAAYYILRPVRDALASDWTLGAIELRGTTVPVIDFRLFLGQARTETTEELIERMERGETSAAAQAGVREASYGLGNFGFAGDGRIWRGHWGKTDGFLTNVGYLPEHGVGFDVDHEGWGGFSINQISNNVETRLG